MKIALIGYGQMGKMIDSIAPEYQIETARRYEKDNPLRDTAEERDALRDVDVLIDFSYPGSAIANIECCAAMKKNIIVGTTGWHDHLDRIKKTVENAGTGMVYASNFSLGVNLFYSVVRHAASVFKTFDMYDPYVEEAHHKKKKDAPSGTAKNILSILEDVYQRDIPVASTRAGYITGLHKVGLDSPVDYVEIIHRAKSREGFARGALVAAQWIAGKTGIYEFGRVLDLIQSEQ